MGRINKNKPKSTKIVAKASSTMKLSSSKTAIKTDDSPVSKEKSKLLNKTITPLKVSSKKEKYRQKHKNLMNKFTLIRKQQKEERARKNREKTAVIGDLKPLKDALPSLDEIFQMSKEKNQIKTGVSEFDNGTAGNQAVKKLSAKAKIKLNKEKFMRKVNSYHALLKDPDFKKNPREAIRYHIQYTNRLIDE